MQKVNLDIMILENLFKLVQLLFAMTVPLTDFIVTNTLLFELVTERIFDEVQACDTLKHKLVHDSYLCVSFQIGNHPVLQYGYRVVIANIMGYLDKSGSALLIETIIVFEKHFKCMHGLFFADEAFIDHP